MECERKNNYCEDIQYLERSFGVKVQVEALEALLGPEANLERSKRRKRVKYGKMLKRIQVLEE